MFRPTTFVTLLGLLAAPVAATAAGAGDPARLERDDMVIEFSAAAVRRGAPVMEDELADVRFTIHDSRGTPLRGLAPGAWLDVADNLRNKEREGADQKSCKEKIALYLKGVVGIRPLVDLNSYYVVVMNQDNSLSVIDPKVSMAGSTSTLSKIVLPAVGADWAHSADDKRIFVTLPTAGKVAQIDVDTFKVAGVADAGAMPMRVVAQPDGRYLWVGNDAAEAGRSGVTVLDGETLKTVAFVPTGRGHHEIAVSGDSLWAFVTSRDDGTVTVIDVRRLKAVREVRVSGQPISLAWSQLSKRLYVADGRDGGVHVVDPGSEAAPVVIPTKPGLGPMRFTPDGRWALVLNSIENGVLVIDPSTNATVHEIAVPQGPFQLEFTRAFAYVRSLGSERVTMITLSSLGAGKVPTVLGFAAGSAPPKAAPDLALASSIAPAAGDAGVLVVNPADSTTYFYMEGMNAASSNYKVRGSNARAVTVVDRSLREIEPGVYATKVKLPAAGRFDVAFSLNTPPLLHCFSTDVAANPRLAQNRKGIDLQWLVEQYTVATTSKLPVRFRLVDQATGKPRTGLTDVRVMWLLAPGRLRQEVAATEVGDGVYEATIAVGQPGAWYVHAASRTLGKDFRDFPYKTLLTSPPATMAGAAAGGAAPR